MMKLYSFNNELWYWKLLFPVCLSEESQESEKAKQEDKASQTANIPNEKILYIGRKKIYYSCRRYTYVVIETKMERTGLKL